MTPLPKCNLGTREMEGDGLLQLCACAEVRVSGSPMASVSCCFGLPDGRLWVMFCRCCQRFAFAFNPEADTTETNAQWCLFHSRLTFRTSFEIINGV